MNRMEFITRTNGPATMELAPGVLVHMLATGSLGAVGLTTAMATFRPGAKVSYHLHPFSEVIVVLSGMALIHVEGRRYLLKQFDAMHVPAGIPHAVHNASSDSEAVLHSLFPSATPTRDAVDREFAVEDRDSTTAHCPEHLVRFATAPVYELAPQAHFRDLFARRFGAHGLCGGYGVFGPGASLPCHYHGYDESITIVSGHAVCQVAGREYALSDYATACIPHGRPHRFLNHSDQPMAMIWVYAGDEPERTLVDTCLCQNETSGT